MNNAACTQDTRLNVLKNTACGKFSFFLLSAVVFSHFAVLKALGFIILGMDKPTEIVIAVDGAEDVTFKTTNKIRDYIEKLIQTFEISTTKSRVSILVYSDKADIKLTLKEGITKQRVLSALDNLKGNGKRDLTLLFNTISESVLDKNSVREDAGKYILLFINGPDDQEKSSKFIEILKKLKRENIQITVVGVGGKVADNTVKKISSSPDDGIVVNENDLLKTLPVVADGLGKSVAKGKTLSDFVF